MCLGLASFASPQDPAPARAISAMQIAAGVELRVTRSPRTGLATFISAPSGRSIPVPVGAAATGPDRALAFVAAYGGAFGLRDGQDVRVVRVERDDLGIDHVRLHQVRSAVPVTGGELTVHLRGNRVVAVNGKTLGDLDRLSLTPASAASQASLAARQLVTQRLGAPAAELSEPRLEIFSRSLLGAGSFPTRLAWFVEARAESLRQFIWIDARSLTVLLHFSQLTDAKNRAIYDANSTSALPGTLIRTEGQAPTGLATLTDALNAYNFSGDTYDYFFNEHARDSFDGAGAQIRSTIRYCEPGDPCPYSNAFWNGTQMVYGQGFVVDDVVAHELTHAVTEKTANLFYYMQSGALNESYSDIFGEAVDLVNGAGNDSPGVRWLMGEEAPGGAIRNMMTPTAFNDPGKMSDTQFRCDTDPIVQDAGGVHTNSGVPNHAFALMVDGGTYNSVTVAGIGLSKAAKVQYRALTQYLLSASDFLDNYNAIQQACSDLIGTSGITAGDCVEVKKALDAVQMSNTWPCLPLQASAPALCSAGLQPVNAFLDNFEGGLSNWTISGDSGTWFRTSDPSNPLGGAAFATSGVDSLWGYNQGNGVPVLSTISRNANLTIPAGARLHFNHSYGFEDSGGVYYDGGQVEYSTNGGVNWTSLNSLNMAGAQYGGTIAAGFGNLLGGQSGFVGDSFGFTGSQYDLSSLAGQTQVRFRFRIGADDIIDDYGWFIDDFRVYTCVQSPPAVTTTVASDVTSASATLNGTVNPNGAATTAVFQYGPTLAYGAQVPVATSPGSGLAVVPIDAAISGLVCNTVYHARAVATNFAGTTNGNDISFLTSACLPTVTVSAPTNVSTTAADIAGNVPSDGGAAITERGFVYSATATNGDPLIGGLGVTKVTVAGTTGAFSSSLSGLTPSTGYTLKAFATNSAGTSYSAPALFTTSDPPAAEALLARTLTANSAARSTLSNGVPQIWYRVRLFANRSYQISAWPVDHDQDVDAAQVEVDVFSDDAGIVQANGVTALSGPLEATPNQSGDGRAFTAVIQPGATGVYKIRVQVVSGGSSTASVNLLLRETTLFSPWTSRAAGFEGFVEMHNNTNAPINVKLRAYNNAGVLQGAGATLTLQPNATDFRTATQLGVPVNVFAGIVLTHDGAFGAVAANITTLNGANGLSFDSPFTPRNPSIQGSPLR